MAKRKTPKKDKVVDLKPKAEKITEQQLERLQGAVRQINILQNDLGALELRKHDALHAVLNWQNTLRGLQAEFMKDYGTSDVNMLNGEIKYNEEDDTDKTDKKDNDREGLQD